MTKTEMFSFLQMLDGDGLVITDNELIVRAIEETPELAKDETWDEIYRENLD